jgi:glycine cleavage system H protein
MVMIVFIITLIIFLLIDYFLQVRERNKREKLSTLVTIPVTEKRNLTLISEPYYHPTHSWARITDDCVTVGADEFAERVLGTVERIEVAPIGSYLKQGQNAWTLYHNKRALPQCSPIEGQVVEVNLKLSRNPSKVNKFPYDKGWILRIKPYSLRQNLRNLIHGEIARLWLESVRSRYIMLFSGIAGPVCQDGGELIDGAGDLLDDNEWNDVLYEFFSYD